MLDTLQVGGTKVKYGLAMPILLRRWFLTDLHHMCVYFEEKGGTKAAPGVSKGRTERSLDGRREK